MRGTITFFIFLLAVMVVPVVHAQTTTPTSTEAVATSSEASSEESEEETAVTPTPAAPGALAPETQKRILNLAANMSNRVDAALDRLTQIAGRLNSRIEKTEAAGVDVMLARAAMRRVNENLAHTKEHIGDIDAIMLNTVTAANPKDAWQGAKREFTEAQIHLREIKGGLQLVVSTLKSAIANPGGEAEAPTEAATSTDLIVS